MGGVSWGCRALAAENLGEFGYTGILGRGTQVVRERSAKPLYVGSIPTRASNLATREAPGSKP